MLFFEIILTKLNILILSIHCNHITSVLASINGNFSQTQSHKPTMTQSILTLWCVAFNIWWGYEMKFSSKPPKIIQYIYHAYSWVFHIPVLMSAIQYLDYKTNKNKTKQNKKHTNSNIYLFMILKGAIDQSRKSHIAPVPYRTIHHFGTKMYTFLFQCGALCDMGRVHCAICETGRFLWNEAYYMQWYS